MGFFQARILEWAAISFPRVSSQPRDWTWVSCVADRRFTVWATRQVYNQSDFGIDHLVMSMYRVDSCVVGKGCLLWPVCFLGKTLSAFALLHLYSKAKFACYSRLLLTSYFCILIIAPKKECDFNIGVCWGAWAFTSSFSLNHSESEKRKTLSRVRLFLTPWTIESLEFSRPGYWSRYPFISPGDPTNPGIEPRSPALQADSLPDEPQGMPKNTGLGSLSFLQGIFLT